MTGGDADDRPTAVIERVKIRNYRSIADCDVRLDRISYLVGPNGAGKSNFLDALRLVADAVTSSLDQAVRERGGFHQIRRRGSGPRGAVSIWLDLRLSGQLATFRFELLGKDKSSFEVASETCSIGSAGYSIDNGELISTEPALPLPAGARLYLVTAASLPAFGPVFDALRRMVFYNVNPAELREAQPPDAGEVLDHAGRNAASVWARLDDEEVEASRAIEDYLSAVVPGVVHVRRESIGAREGLQFTQDANTSINPTFPAQSMSDGTLRAFGVLLALLQRNRTSGDPVLVGIEEPEAAVHPAAAAVLRDAIVEAGRSRQVVVTTHSPDLLDDPGIEPGSILAVGSTDGNTVISRPDAAGLSALREGLYTAGELLRAGQLLPEPGEAHQ
jgi:predicted ATPase